MATDKHGMFYWNELLTHDVEAAKAFFASTLGWTFVDAKMPHMAYWIAKSADQIVGGVMAMPVDMGPDTRPHWMSYIAVDDVDARVKKAEAAGAIVHAQPFDVPQVGRIAILADPTGAIIGWITPASAPAASDAA